MHIIITWNFICAQIGKENQARTASDIRISPLQNSVFLLMWWICICENNHPGHCISLYQHLLKQYHQLLRGFKPPSPPNFFQSLSLAKENPKEYQACSSTYLMWKLKLFENIFKWFPCFDSSWDNRILWLVLQDNLPYCFFNFKRNSVHVDNYFKETNSTTATKRYFFS